MYFKRNGESMATSLRNDKYGIFLVLVTTYNITRYIYSSLGKACTRSPNLRRQPRQKLAHGA